MSDLVVVTFPDATSAFELRTELYKLQKEYLIDMDDAVVVTRNENGRIKLHQSTSLTALGAVGGSFWGLLIGMLFFNPLLGMAVGAGSGAISGALSDIGIDDNFMRDLGDKLQGSQSALFVLVRSATTDKVVAELKPFADKGGKITKTSLSADDEKKLRDAIEAHTPPEASAVTPPAS
ncbi:DUF1269 domain-containing protein [Tropicimonas sp.]|uniref:DUF1269 domain-containing protein n=1 Tax=Tropicimonas sp. TaxID=2067044 RepID=UPI003A8BE842